MRIRLAALMGMLAALAAIYSTLIAPRWLRTTWLRVAVPGLPPEWDGLRIAHLSDFHAGGQGVGLPMLRDAKRTAIDFQPDLIAITGDFYDEGRWMDAGNLYTEWPAGTPLVAVLGNHDWRGGLAHIDRLREELCRGGVALLCNSATQLTLRGKCAWVAGVDDPHTGRSDADAALGCIPPGEDLLAFLAHSPSEIARLPVGAAKLMLSGHTHGGQVRLTPSGRIPFIQLVRRLRGLRSQPPLPYARGVHWARGVVLIISEGLGLSTIAVRFRTRPEIILIELCPAGPDGADCGSAERFVENLSDEHRLVRWLT